MVSRKTILITLALASKYFNELFNASSGKRMVVWKKINEILTTVGWRVVSILLVGLAFTSATQAQATVGNGVYEVHVSRRPGFSIGSWNAITASGHDVGANKNVLYNGLTTGTNFSSLRVYKSGGVTTDYTFGGHGSSTNLDTFVTSEGPSPLPGVPAGQGWRTVWTITPENLVVTQDVFVIGTNTANSAIYHTVEIKNNGNTPVRVGWRNLYDWTVNAPSFDDGPNNQLESVCGTVLIPTTTNEFLHTPVTAQIVRVSVDPGTPTYQPLLGLTFDPGFYPLPITTPEAYAFVSWHNAYFSSNAFDYTVNTSLSPSDTAGLSWFGRTAASALEVAPGGSIRLTQTIYAAEPGGCATSCLQPLDEKILCTTDGSGRFIYKFKIKNLASFDAYHLFIVNPSPGVAVSPDYINLSSNPLSTNEISSELQVMISGAQPGDLVCFLLTIHDQTLDLCCSIEKCITMPECDCAQIVEDSIGCFQSPLGVFSIPVYSFVVQNLTPNQVKYVLVTPVSPSGLLLFPNVHTLSPTIGYGQQSPPLGILLGAPGGTQACFRISLHTADFRECCSILKCVTVPYCRSNFFVGNVLVDPVAVPPGGQAVVSFDIRNIGADPADPAIHQIRLFIPGGVPGVAERDIDVPLATFMSSKIAPGESESFQMMVTIPREVGGIQPIKPGATFIRIAVDVENTVEESNEEDNTTDVPITITPSPSASSAMLANPKTRVGGGTMWNQPQSAAIQEEVSRPISSARDQAILRRRLSL